MRSLLDSASFVFLGISPVKGKFIQAVALKINMKNLVPEDILPPQEDLEDLHNLEGV